MIRDFNINLFDMVMGLSNAIDLVSAEVDDHHKRVAYIALRLAAEYGLSKADQRMVIMAGALHDVGAVFLKKQVDSLDFETDFAEKHSKMGYYFLKQFKPFEEIAPLVKYHHVEWNYGKGEFVDGEKVPESAYVLNLADRIEVLTDRSRVSILSNVNSVVEEIKQMSGTTYNPDLIDAFIRLSQKEYFWLELNSANLNTILASRSKYTSIDLDLKGLLDLAKLFGCIIDFRSHFTAIHSSGVAAIAEAVACFMGWSKRECLMLRAAGFFHDLGKLAVPIEVLEKPGKLNTEEMNYIRSHTYYTYRVLDNIEGLRNIRNWASFHHEYLNGKGYPFHYEEEELTLGARILAVADVFTAITEDRPYRKGMDSAVALQTMKQMAEDNVLDKKLVKVVEENFEQLNEIRVSNQEEAVEEYEEFKRQMGL